MTTDERLVRAETNIKQHGKRFDSIKAALTRLTVHINLWGALNTALIVALIVLSKR